MFASYGVSNHSSQSELPPFPNVHSPDTSPSLSTPALDGHTSSHPVDRLDFPSTISTPPLPPTSVTASSPPKRSLHHPTDSLYAPTWQPRHRLLLAASGNEPVRRRRRRRRGNGSRPKRKTRPLTRRHRRRPASSTHSPRPSTAPGGRRNATEIPDSSLSSPLGQSHVGSPATSSPPSTSTASRLTSQRPRTADVPILSPPTPSPDSPPITPPLSRPTTSPSNSLLERELEYFQNALLQERMNIQQVEEENNLLRNTVDRLLQMLVHDDVYHAIAPLIRSKPTVVSQRRDPDLPRRRDGGCVTMAAAVEELHRKFLETRLMVQQQQQLKAKREQTRRLRSQTRMVSSKRRQTHRNPRALTGPEVRPLRRVGSDGSSTPLGPGDGPQWKSSVFGDGIRLRTRVNRPSSWKESDELEYDEDFLNVSGALLLSYIQPSEHDEQQSEGEEDGDNANKSVSAPAMLDVREGDVVGMNPPLMSVDSDPIVSRSRHSRVPRPVSAVGSRRRRERRKRSRRTRAASARGLGRGSNVNTKRGFVSSSGSVIQLRIRPKEQSRTRW